MGKEKATQKSIHCLKGGVITMNRETKWPVVEHLVKALKAMTEQPAA